MTDDCGGTPTYTTSAPLPVTSGDSPPTASNFFNVVYVCHGNTFTSPDFVDVQSALDWATTTLGDFGAWTLQGNNLVITNSICEGQLLGHIVGKPIIFGCTDCTTPALNCNPLANYDDGSCKYPVTASPNYIDIICANTPLTQTVEYYPGLSFDIYKETCNTNIHRPVFIGLHPGGGDKSTYKQYPKDFASRGYLGVSIDYGDTGSSDGTGYTANMQRDNAINVWLVTRFLRANALTFGINPNNIFWGGTSAGAITNYQAMLASLNINDPYFLGSPNASRNLLYSVFSSRPSATFSQAGAANPHFTTYINNTNKINKFYNGTNDCVVPYSFDSCGINGAKENYTQMVASGNASTLVPYLGEGHKIDNHHSDILLGGSTLITGATDIGIIKAFAALII
jgi:hypothetical protein